jgi:hypothetical protein
MISQEFVETTATAPLGPLEEDVFSTIFYPGYITGCGIERCVRVKGDWR